MWRRRISIKFRSAPRHRPPRSGPKLCLNFVQGNKYGLSVFPSGNIINSIPCFRIITFLENPLKVRDYSSVTHFEYIISLSKQNLLIYFCLGSNWGSCNKYLQVIFNTGSDKAMQEIAYFIIFSIALRRFYSPLSVYIISHNLQNKTKSANIQFSSKDTEQHGVFCIIPKLLNLLTSYCPGRTFPDYITQRKF